MDAYVIGDSFGVVQYQFVCLSVSQSLSDPFAEDSLDICLSVRLGRSEKTGLE